MLASLPRAAVAFVVLTFLATSAGAGEKVTLGLPTSEVVPLGTIDHGAWDKLLKHYCDEHGLVDYAAWKHSARDLAALDGYLGTLSSGDIASSGSPRERLAFWINAYNALTVAGILREYPTTTIRNHTSRDPDQFDIWHDLLLIVGGKGYSLDVIENEMLRGQGEKRVRFAITCASMACPRLRREAYTAEKLDAQLTDSAQQFFARPANLRIDFDTHTVYVSRLLHWFERDFGTTPQKGLAALAEYFPDQQAWRAVTATDYRVEYVTYDWHLNDHASKPTARR